MSERKYSQEFLNEIKMNLRYTMQEWECLDKDKTHKLILKILDDFSDDELKNMKSNMISFQIRKQLRSIL